MAGSATTSTPSATSSNFHQNSPISSSTLQQQFIPPASDDATITGTSRDGSLRIRIDKMTLAQLAVNEITDLYRDPVAFIMTTQIPLMCIYKRVIKDPRTDLDIHHFNTEGTGYCQPLMLEQLQRRHQNKSVLCKSLKSNNVIDRTKLQLFITSSLIKATTFGNPDTSYHSCTNGIM